MKKLLNSITKYFKGVGKEIKRVRWTKGKELTKLSITTVVFMVGLGLYFYGIDMLVSLLRSVA